MKTYLLAFGIIAAILIGGVGAAVALDHFLGKKEHDRIVARVRERRLAEELRWNGLTPAQQAAEIKSRQEAEADRKATQEKKKVAEEIAASVKRHDAFISRARGACLISIKRMLHDPYSAKFDMTTSWYVEDQSNGVLLVQPKLHAKNAFGAYRYSTWNCRVRAEGENVRILHLAPI